VDVCLDLAPRRDLDDPERESGRVDGPREELHVAHAVPLAGCDDYWTLCHVAR
jgi:hypothetical protein